ncbi:MAG: hypothetical protein D6753_12390 [Planctomycetota bacterium]|nr:MAG: hypothetical protein D6753_12390 [Planctomycetota bacterium]
MRKPLLPAWPCPSTIARTIRRPFFLHCSMPETTPEIWKNRRDWMAICQAIAYRASASESWLPAEDGSAEDLPAPVAAVAQEVMRGKPLADVLARGDRLAARILRACIETGEQTGRLADGLLWWLSWMEDRQRARGRLATAMVYPSILVCVTLISLGVVVWNIVPTIENSYLTFHRTHPWWLQGLSLMRANFPAVMVAITLLTLLPPVAWWCRTRGVTRSGVPRNRADRLAQQALAARVAAVLLDRGRPLSVIARLATLAAGGTTRLADEAFDRIRAQQPVPVLGRELSLALIAMHADILPGREALEHVRELTELLSHGARTADLYRTRWLPLMVAAGAGAATVAIYVFLVYLPWVLMLRDIVRVDWSSSL